MPGHTLRLRASTSNGDTISSESLPSSPAEAHIETRFIAETLLPTQTGKFRLRGYKHTVRVLNDLSVLGFERERVLRLAIWGSLRAAVHSRA